MDMMVFLFDIPECLILSSIAQYDCAIFYFPRLAPAFLHLLEVMCSTYASHKP